MTVVLEEKKLPANNKKTSLQREDKKGSLLLLPFELTKDLVFFVGIPGCSGISYRNMAAFCLSCKIAKDFFISFLFFSWMCPEGACEACSMCGSEAPSVQPQGGSTFSAPAPALRAWCLCLSGGCFAPPYSTPKVNKSLGCDPTASHPRCLSSI